MANINKLSVEQALDKLRGTEPKRTKLTQLDEKIGALDQELRQMKAQNRRISRDQKARTEDGKD